MVRTILGYQKIRVVNVVVNVCLAIRSEISSIVAKCGVYSLSLMIEWVPTQHL